MRVDDFDDLRHTFASAKSIHGVQSPPAERDAIVHHVLTEMRKLDIAGLESTRAFIAKIVPASDRTKHDRFVSAARGRYDSLRSEILDKSLSLTQAAKKMRLSPEGLSARVDRREMLAFPDKNRKMIPIELIDTEEVNATVPGLPDVLKSTSMEPFRLAVWLLRESRALGGKKPVDLLRRGDVARVVTAVKGVGAS